MSMTAMVIVNYGHGVYN